MRYPCNAAVAWPKIFYRGEYPAVLVPEKGKDGEWISFTNPLDVPLEVYPWREILLPGESVTYCWMGGWIDVTEVRAAYEARLSE